MVLKGGGGTGSGFRIPGADRFQCMSKIKDMLFVHFTSAREFAKEEISAAEIAHGTANFPKRKKVPRSTGECPMLWIFYVQNMYKT